MRTRIFLAILAAVAIAGCSGGGGLGLGTQNNNNSPATQQEIAQAGTEAGLAPVEQGSLQVGLFNGNMGVPLSTSRSPLSTFAASPNGSCNNGVEYTVTVISPTQTQYETKYFYDKACVSLAKDVVALVTVNSASSESIVRTAKNYTLAGLLLSTRNTNYAITGAPLNFSAVLTGDVLIGSSSSPAIQFGHQFTIAPQSGRVYTIAANSGKVVNNGNPRINESFGHMGVLSNGTMTIDSSTGNLTFAGSHAGTCFKGSLGSLTLSSTPPFTVSGGTELGTNNVSGSATFDKYGNIVSVSITGTLWNGDSINVTSSGTPPGVSINGSITDPSGNNVATFQVDQNGNGIITYANGQQALIIDWHVVR